MAAYCGVLCCANKEPCTEHSPWNQDREIYYESETSTDGKNEVISIRGVHREKVVTVAAKFRAQNTVLREGYIEKQEYCGEAGDQCGEWRIMFTVKGDATLVPLSFELGDERSFEDKNPQLFHQVDDLIGKKCDSNIRQHDFISDGYLKSYLAARDVIAELLQRIILLRKKL